MLWYNTVAMEFTSQQYQTKVLSKSVSWKYSLAHMDITAFLPDKCPRQWVVSMVKLQPEEWGLAVSQSHSAGTDTWELLSSTQKGRSSAKVLLVPESTTGDRDELVRMAQVGRHRLANTCKVTFSCSLNA